MFAIWLIAIALYIWGRTNADIEPSPWQKAYRDMMLNRKYWYKLILYSGKEANDLGDYNQCSRDTWEDALGWRQKSQWGFPSLGMV